MYPDREDSVFNERLHREEGSRANRFRFGLRITREGKWFLGVTFLVGFAAVNTGNNLLYLVLGLLMSLIILSGVLAEFAVSRIRITRGLPRRAFASVPTGVELVVKNGKRRNASYSLEVEDVVLEERTDRRCYFLKIGPGNQQIAAYRRIPERRGRLRFAAVRLSTRYPFGFFEKWRRIPLEDEILVYPKIVPVEVPSRFQITGGHNGPATVSRRGEDVAYLRDWRTGDERRAVHWRRTARLGRLVVREREEINARRATLFVDNYGDATNAVWTTAFEEAISKAASLAGELLSNGVSVQIVTRDGASPRIAGGNAADPIWTFLALLEATNVAELPRTKEDYMEVA